MKFKKLSAAALALSMLSATTAVVANADVVVEEAITSNGLIFSTEPVPGVLLDNALAVKGLDDENLTEIIIPEEVNGLKVTIIGRYAFYNCKSLKSITIPDSVTYILPYAFQHCKNLTDVTIGNGVIGIGFYAFAGCDTLTNITIPNSVTEIDEYAFSGTGLASVEIPNSVTYIDEGVFEGCSSLKSITIPDSVTTIHTRAFQGCSSLESITIPDSVTEIGESVFEGCSSLKSVTIPDSVTRIDSYAFSGCESLESITIPDSVTEIGEYVFDGCKGLTKISYNQKEYGADELYDLYDAINISSGNYDENGLYIINRFTTTYLEKCLYNVEEVNVPDNVDCIGTRAFNGRTKLKKITIPDSVTSISDEAFKNCTGLTEIIIPGSVERIGESTFENCTGLESVTLPDGLTKIGSYAFRGCESLTSIDIPDSVTSISVEAFKNCKGLTEIIIPGSVERIGWSTFENCTGLKSVTLPDGLTEIEFDAFRGCESLTSIDIPESVTTIYGTAFYNSGLTNINGTPGSYAETFAKEHGYSFNGEATETPEVTEPDDDTEPEVIEVENNGVKAEYEEGVVPEGAEFSAELKSDENGEYVYDLKFVKDGKDVDKFNGKVTVKLPLPEALKGKTVYVYYVLDGKYMENLNAKVEGDYVVFTTTHFSEYLLTSEEKEVETAIPDTGFAGFAMLGVVALAGAAAVVSRKRK